MPNPNRMIALLFAPILLGTAAAAQTTVTLQQGLNGYSGAVDNWIICCSGADWNKGADVEVDMRATSDYGLFRFAIFQSDGGPVPNGATINSATLSLYKAYGPDAVFKASRLLKNWTEMGSTWNSTGTGALWSSPGAQGAGTDVLAAADGQGSAPDSAANNCADGIGHDICWLNIDVTAGVQAFASGGAQNYGWLLQQVSSSDTYNYKDFNSSNVTTFPQYRPKLTITYTAAASGTNVTLQQGLNGYSGAADNWIICCSGADWNKGADVEVDMRATSDYGLFRFAIFQSEGGPVPNGATITSATLSLYKAYGPDAVFKASRLLKNWTEMGSTWNSTGTGALWSTPGAQGAGTDVLAAADGQGSAPDSAANNCADGIGHEICWLNIDVTSGVQAFASGAAQNYGWLLQQVSSSGTYNYKDFNSSNVTTFPQYRPKLTINYSGSTCTVPTASFTATPSSGMAPLAVTFDASASQDGTSAITSLTLQFGDGSQVTWGSKTQTQSHTYTSPNTYTARLTATSSCGTSTAVTRTITVTDGKPIARLTASPTSGSPPLDVQFSASGSTDGSSPITSLTLTFGDGQQVSWSDKTVPQSHTYARPGTYTASLTATNSAGTSAPSTQTISVGPGSCTVPPATPPVVSGVAIATFHSMSLYYNPPSAPAGDQIFVRYRRGSDDPNVAGWKQGHPLWYDTRGVHSYHGRGSVVELQPGTAYVFEVSTDNVNWQHIPGPQGDAVEPCPSTWSETFPVGTTLTPWTGLKTSTTSSFYKGSRSGSARNHVLLANQSGSASGYTVYDFTGANATAQTNNSSGWYPVVISGSYIILKGLKTVGGEAGIFIDPGSHDIVIDNVDVTGYSRDNGDALNWPLSGHRAINEDAGIKFPDASYGDIWSTRRIVIQHSRIHNPAFGSNSWDLDHPYGASPITMYPTGGQIVIRYNAVYSTTDGTPGGPPDLNHFHEDGLILGGCNDTIDECASQGRGIGPDVDIYKNVVMHYFDDGVETDGDGINNRVWKNYFDYGGASAVSTTPTYVGPTYVWRNVYNRARMWIAEPWGNEHEREYMMKAGGIVTNGGRRYLYHNTSMQPPYTSESAGAGPNGLGAGFGAGGNGGAKAMQNTISRNNVFEMWKSNSGTFDLDGAFGNDLDYDLSNGVMSESHGYQGTTPQYQSGNGWSAYWNGRYRLVPGTRGYDDGVVIPNFNDAFSGAGPDRGAHEDGTPDMDFGTGASGK